MGTIRLLLEAKGHEILTIGPEDSVFDAIKLMAERNVGSLLVMKNNELAGIISERDYARNVFLKGRSSPDTKVKDIMSKRVICAVPEQTVEQAMAVMTEKRIRHLPVLENDEVVGVISIGDLVSSIIKDQQFIIDQLEHYISG